jgi:hypothetical protein
MLKTDFSNAFNSVHLDSIFQAVHDELPELYTFIFMCYYNTSFLSFVEHLLLSDEGAQQGDPLGPLMICPTALKLGRNMKSEFNT